MSKVINDIRQLYGGTISSVTAARGRTRPKPYPPPTVKYIHEQTTKGTHSPRASNSAGRALVGASTGPLFFLVISLLSSISVSSPVWSWYISCKPFPCLSGAWKPVLSAVCVDTPAYAPLLFLRRIRNHITAAIVARAATPPMTPPTIAPVSEWEVWVTEGEAEAGAGPLWPVLLLFEEVSVKWVDWRSVATPGVSGAQELCNRVS